MTDAEGWRAYANLPVLRITAAFDPAPSSFYDTMGRAFQEVKN